MLWLAQGTTHAFEGKNFYNNNSAVPLGYKHIAYACTLKEDPSTMRHTV
jgi:hypothetical protein